MTTTDADQQAAGDPAADVVSVTLHSNPKFLPLVRSLADEGAAMAGFDDAERHGIVLAVTEAHTNVIRHVYGGATDRRIDVLLHNQAQHVSHGDRGLRRVRESGQDRVPPGLDEVRPGGLGVHLIKSTMDEVRYRKNAHGGTTLTLIKCPENEREPS